MESTIDISDANRWRALEYATCFSNTIKNGATVPIGLDLYKLGVLRNELDYGKLSRAAATG